MNDLECPMFLYYVICYEKFKKVMQRTEKEALGQPSIQSKSSWQSIVEGVTSHGQLVC